MNINAYYPPPAPGSFGMGHQTGGLDSSSEHHHLSNGFHHGFMSPTQHYGSSAGHLHRSSYDQAQINASSSKRFVDSGPGGDAGQSLLRSSSSSEGRLNSASSREHVQGYAAAASLDHVQAHIHHQHHHHQQQQVRHRIRLGPPRRRRLEK